MKNEYKEKEEIKTPTVTEVIVIVDALSIRNDEGKKVGIIRMGNTKITDTKEIDGVKWGKLFDGSGWINLDFTREVD